MTDMNNVTSKSDVERPRSRWVGQPVEPQNKCGESPNGRQKFYGAIELYGVDEPIYVNDVVQVLPKHSSGGSEKKRFRLTQGLDITAVGLRFKNRTRTGDGFQDLACDTLVLSMWEDTFTGVCKFQARVLIHTSDLPQDVLSRLCAARRTFSNDIGSSKDNHRDCDGQAEYNEVFLTPKLEDLEVQLIVRPVTLSVTPSPKTAILAELDGKMGPRLTHTYDESTGDFAPVDDTDSIFKYARVRQSEAVDFASRENQKHGTTKNDNSVKCTGWLLPKRSGFFRKGRGEIGSYDCGGFEANDGSCFPPATPVHVGSPVSAIGREISKDSKLEGVSNSMNDKRKEGVDRDDEVASTDNVPSGSSKKTAMVKRGGVPEKSAREWGSQRRSDSDAEANGDSFVASFFSTPMLSPSFQRHSRASATTGAWFLLPRPRRSDMSPVSEGGRQVAIRDRGGNYSTAIRNQLTIKQTRSSSIRDVSKAQVKISRKLLRPTSSGSGSLTRADGRSKVSCKRRRKSTNSGAKTTSTYADGGFANKMGQEESAFPPCHTTVGKEFQAEIPDLLSYEERNQAPLGTSARMVWRSIRDWDPQSRGMLAEYLHAANGVVRAKQARPGVAVHVRLGGIPIGDDQEDDQIDIIDRAGSYAVWAVTAGRDTCDDVVRVACSEMAQTEVPRSAIQRVQCEEEALAALVKTRCILDDFDPALGLLAKTSLGPQSVEQWTLNQVRTLERALHDQFDPKRRLHGWATPGIAMDREDFIDLANVSKRVPGKTPAQVLAFYRRYLAAAEPLTDVVYGPKAAEARRQEEVHRDCEVDKQYNLGGGPASGSSRTANLRADSIQTSYGSQRASPGNLRKGTGSRSDSGLPNKGLSSSKSQVLRLPSPKPSQEHILKARKIDVDQSTAADTSVGHNNYLEDEPPLFRATAGKYSSGGGECSSGLTAPNLPVSRSARSSHAVDDIASAGHGPTEGPFDRTNDDDEGGHCVRNKTTSGAQAVITDDVNSNSDGGRATYSVIQHGRRAGDNSTKSSPDRPPVAEIIEVQDSDEETCSQVSAEDRRKASLAIPDAKTLLPKLVGKAATTYPNTLEPQELKRIGRQMRSLSAGPVSAPIVQLPTTDPVRPRSAAFKGSSMEQPRTGRVTNTPNAVPILDAGLTEVQGHVSWDRRSSLRCHHHRPHIQRRDVRYMYGVGGDSAPELGTVPLDNNVQHILEKTPTDDMFGVMAPCWRLLERAKSYMDEDQLVYMRGLILLHAKKPMSRDQVLERAEGCLQNQDHIFAAFVKMFDRINISPSVPLYPTEKKKPGSSPCSGRRQVMPYTSSYASPTTVPEHPGSAPYLSPPRTLLGEAGKHTIVSPSNVSI